MLTVQSEHQVKRILFPGGDQGKGRWKLVVAAIKLANRPVNKPRSCIKSLRTFSSAPSSKVSLPKKPWKVSIKCPHVKC